MELEQRAIWPGDQGTLSPRADICTGSCSIRALGKAGGGGRHFSPRERGKDRQVRLAADQGGKESGVGASGMDGAHPAKVSGPESGGNRASKAPEQRILSPHPTASTGRSLTPAPTEGG